MKISPKKILKGIVNATDLLFKGLLFPNTCAACGRTIDYPSQGAICKNCLGGIKKIMPPLCTICGNPFISGTGINHTCGDCIKDPPSYSLARAAFEYGGSIRNLIHRIKFYDDRYALKTLCEIVKQNMPAMPDPGVLIPVPLHAARLRQRGFNQTAELARRIFPDSVVALDMLARHKKTLQQTGLTSRQRRRNVEDAFSVTGKINHTDHAKITIIDDILTTGSTVNECAKALLKAGADQIEVFTVARATIKNIN